MHRSYILVLASSLSLVALAQGCSDDGPGTDTAVTVTPDTGNNDNSTSNGDGDGDETGSGSGEEDGCPPITGCLDLPEEDDPVGCDSMGNCNLVDLLFVIDNSGTMGAEQLNLARNFPLLVQQLEGLESENGGTGANVNIMVTTTDFGNPLCKPFANHEPEAGAPVASACVKRLDRSRELLRTLGPESAFARGFSITMTEEGKVVTNPDEVANGEVLKTRMAGGTLRSRTEKC
jgi:hypothetical protein